MKGATNVSRGTLEMRIGEVAPDKQAPIVCHCGGGNRGALAALVGHGRLHGPRHDAVTLEGGGAKCHSRDQ